MEARPHRLIVNTDAKNEADDQFAIVQALLSPTLDVCGIIPAHFGSSRTQTSMLESRAEVDEILRLLDLLGSVRVANGAPHALPDEATPVPSEGSRFIVEQASAAEDRLFIAFLGPLTDMASALLEEPSLGGRDIVVVWIGGPPYGGIEAAYAPEFNLSNDIAAANVVMASGVEVWQIPMNVYCMVGVGHDELRQRVAPYGELGSYLTRQLIELNESFSTPMEYRTLGDNPAIGAVMNQSGGTWRLRPAPRFTLDGEMAPGPDPDRLIRVYESFDARWLVEDLFAKIRRHAEHPLED
ncbi:nucleoside hydrolase [Tessaracoccus defluvii]|uniref:Nucleoside hydrolase n=1 Tax=Tessaracoccus defluvii TaxID=1285901 RepID=A0A7H0H4I1_9ACTN|nr:nucleoside hydrolase [Tessaracoccus defluvii]QNP55447.1 nucleoside hydrolase [Tessaracoccus defluvii]